MTKVLIQSTPSSLRILQAVRKILLFANTKHNAKCVAEHIAAIQAGSPHHWFVVNALTNRMADKIDLEYFDAVGFIILYTLTRGIIVQRN